MTTRTVSAELIAILAVGAMLLGTIVYGQNRIEDRLLAVEKEQARASGLLEGLGLTGRTEPRTTE